MPTCNLRTNTAAEDKFAEEAAAMECKSCTASSSAKCTRAASLLKKDNIRAIYCNADFLVVWATGEPAYDANSTDYLGSIPLPPGGNDGRRAGDTCRVRTAKSLLTVYKIPLSPTQLTATQAASQEVLNSIPNVPGMPAGGACGMAIDGVPMFPNYNNRGQPTWESCEVDRCNAHAGKGSDYHYHGDPYGSKCLYHDADYEGSHPPLIGYSLDGYESYGRYTTASQSGIGDDLDGCGGHEHGGIEGYHYHSTVAQETAASLDGVSAQGSYTFTAYRLGPTTCWRGDISKISNFWNAAGHAPNYDRSKDNSLSTQNDYHDLKPCCGSTPLYAAPGMAFSGVAGAATQATPAAPAAPTDDCASYCAAHPSDGSAATTTTTTTTTGNACGTGVDDKGTACPRDDSNGRPCPPGCEPTNVAAVDPNTCSECVAAGRSWQIGSCQPADLGRCPVQDVGCAVDAAGCAADDAASAMDERCARMTSCAGCAGLSGCTFVKGGSCMATDSVSPMMPPSDIVRDAAQCSVATVPSAGTVTVTQCAAGNDDQGRKCPRDDSNGKPCPRGCESGGGTASDGQSGCGECGCGTQDNGRQCPAKTNGQGRCPPGCAATSASGRRLLATIDYTGLYATSNAMPYICPAGTDTTRTWACAQSEYPAGANEGSTAELACSSGTIECIAFATVGKVGGSCGGDPFKDDPSGQWAYMPASVGAACIGRSSCVIEQGDGTLNSVAFDAGSTGAGSLKFKIIAVCSGAATSTGTGTVPATSTAGSKCSCLTRPAANAAPGGNKGIQEQTDTKVPPVTSPVTMIASRGSASHAALAVVVGAAVFAVLLS